MKTWGKRHTLVLDITKTFERVYSDFRIETKKKTFRQRNLGNKEDNEATGRVESGLAKRSLYFSN